MARARATHPALAALLSLVTGCAATPPHPAPASARAAADLPAALPPRREAADGQRATTGEPAVLVRAARRAQVVELYGLYVRAIYEQSLDALRPLLDDWVFGLANQAGGPVPREDVVVLHERLLRAVDAGGRALSDVLDRPRVTTYAELHRRDGTVRFGAMRPGDWLVEGSPNFARGANPTETQQGLARLLLVRWVGDHPRIVGMSEDLLRHARRN